MLHGPGDIGTFCSGSLYHQVIGLFHTFPALIPVHGVVSTYDRSQVRIMVFTKSGQICQESFAAFGIHIASVRKGMDAYLLKAV